MADFSIGLSGLNAVQKSINIVGNNIANAATEGYHKQRIELSPSYYSTSGSVIVGGGVEVKDVRRVIDTLLEQEIYHQQSEAGQLSQEDNTLRTIENAFGDFSTEDGGLNSTIDKFFTSLHDLSKQPTVDTWLNQFVSTANSMAGQFRTVGEYLTTLQTQIRLESQNVVDNINTLADQIAKLNDKIESIKLVDGDANAMCDQRDKLISDLSNSIGIQTINRENDVVDVSVGGIPMVTGSTVCQIELGADETGDLGISIKNGNTYETDVQGGKLGGLFTLQNDTITNIQTDLDKLANTIIQEINKCHVQGIGPAGSFDSLTGWVNKSENLADFSNVTEGDVYIRVTKISDGTVERTEIPVMKDAGSDSLSDIVNYINASVSNVHASLNSSNQLIINAETGYKFDFLPASYSEPKAADTNFNGANDPKISISGVYKGDSNDRLTFTVKGTGQIGNDSDLQLIVRDSHLNELATVNIGTGYPEGSPISIGNTGLTIKLTSPTAIADLVNGDSFSIDVFSSSDTSGLLAATGINTFFSGDSATSIAVNNDIIENPLQTATMRSSGTTDNTNVLKMYELQDKSISDLRNMSIGEFYRQMTTGIGQDLSIVETRKDNTDAMLVNLNNQQSEGSGVDVNEESAQLLVYQQMFQSLAKYMSVINETLKNVMDII